MAQFRSLIFLALFADAHGTTYSSLMLERIAPFCHRRHWRHKWPECPAKQISITIFKLYKLPFAILLLNTVSTTVDGMLPISRTKFSYFKPVNFLTNSMLNIKALKWVSWHGNVTINILQSVQVIFFLVANTSVNLLSQNIALNLNQKISNNN